MFFGKRFDLAYIRCVELPDRPITQRHLNGTCGHLLVLRDRNAYNITIRDSFFKCFFCVVACLSGGKTHPDRRCQQQDDHQKDKALILLFQRSSPLNIYSKRQNSFRFGVYCAGFWPLKAAYFLTKSVRIFIYHSSSPSMPM